MNIFLSVETELFFSRRLKSSRNGHDHSVLLKGPTHDLSSKCLNLISIFLMCRIVNMCSFNVRIIKVWMSNIDRELYYKLCCNLIARLNQSPANNCFGVDT